MAVANQQPCCEHWNDLTTIHTLLHKLYFFIHRDVIQEGSFYSCGIKECVATDYDTLI